MLSLLQTTTYAALATLLTVTGAAPGGTARCTVGLSGILFAALVLLCSHPAAPRQFSIVGVVPVPTPYLPALLVMLNQLLLPASSLLGHVSGLVAGYAFLSPAMQCLHLSHAASSTLEGYLTSWHARPTFVLSTDLPVTTNPHSLPAASPLAAAATFFRSLLARGERLTAVSVLSTPHTPLAAEAPAQRRGDGQGHTVEARRATHADAAEARLALGLRSSSPRLRDPLPEESLV